jgi:hypothetical protein
MSFPMRVKAFAILSHRLNMVALRVSKMRPMDRLLITFGGRLPGPDFFVQRTHI